MNLKLKLALPCGIVAVPLLLSLLMVVVAVDTNSKYVNENEY